ncbi:MAG: hypothetical protein IH614_09005 [Desulfuromonadales bacterium]|nr:hypothetical protein [Desulfuromonadales bacterium]
MQEFPVPWWGWLIVVVLILVCVSLVSLVFEVGSWLVEKDPPGGGGDDSRQHRPR